MRIAYIGDFINHGYNLHTSGTPLVILLSKVSYIENIDVYCPVRNEKTEEFVLPKKVTVLPTYDYQKSLSILNLLKIRKLQYDLIIFNLLPTAFGNKNLSNIIGLSIPLMMKCIFKLKQLRVIYHNSVYTNDPSLLGYNSIIDRFRIFGLGIIERFIFTNLETFVLLRLYVKRISKKIRYSRVKFLNVKYLEAVTTAYINNLDNIDIGTSIEHNSIPVILMHGNWGPQKNLELGLKTLRIVRELGKHFRLIISGGINNHFESYQEIFRGFLNDYADVVDLYRGKVSERDLTKLFQRTDLLLLPYKAPGGHSGVLELAMFFEIPTIAITFPEFEEEAFGEPYINLVKEEHFYDAVLDALNKTSKKQTITNYDNKIESIVENLKKDFIGVETH